MDFMRLFFIWLISHANDFLHLRSWHNCVVYDACTNDNMVLTYAHGRYWSAHNFSRPALTYWLYLSFCRRLDQSAPRVFQCTSANVKSDMRLRLSRTVSRVFWCLLALRFGFCIASTFFTFFDTTSCSIFISTQQTRKSFLSFKKEIFWFVDFHFFDTPWI